MAVHTWQVPILDYPLAAELLWEAHLADRRRDRVKLQSLTERLRSMGCPRVDPRDTIEVVPAGGRLVIRPEPLTGLPR